MSKNKELAAKLLEANPEKNGVYITEDSQAFFNKASAFHHTKNRGYKEPTAFFREGVETPNQITDNAKTLENALKSNEVNEGIIASIDEVITNEDHEITVTTETAPTLAAVIGLKESLIESNAENIELKTALEEANTANDTQKEQLVEQKSKHDDAIESLGKAQAKIEELEAANKKDAEALSKAAKEITDLQAKLEKTKTPPAKTPAENKTTKTTK